MHLHIATYNYGCLATYMYNNTGKILDELCSLSMIISQVRYVDIATHLHCLAILYITIDGSDFHLVKTYNPLRYVMVPALLVLL